MDGGLALDVIISQSPTGFHHFACEYQPSRLRFFLGNKRTDRTRNPHLPQAALSFEAFA